MFFCLSFFKTYLKLTNVILTINKNAPFRFPLLCKFSSQGSRHVCMFFSKRCRRLPKLETSARNASSNNSNHNLKSIPRIQSRHENNYKQFCKTKHKDRLWRKCYWIGHDTWSSPSQVPVKSVKPRIKFRSNIDCGGLLAVPQAGLGTMTQFKFLSPTTLKFYSIWLWNFASTKNT